MSTDSTDPNGPDTPNGPEGEEQAIAARLIDLPIEVELKESYLTYAMSVIVSRALPDVRDGLKPSQRRILVAMNDLNLSPGGSTSKCAGIVGETMKRYHPHGDMAIYPTLVRLAQEWATRYPLIDKQGNFGSIAGLPPAAMRYTEARLANFASVMLEDLKLDTVDFLPTYDEKQTEPTVLPSKLPNLLVNGSAGIAVGMATSIPPHNLAEVCRGVIALIDNPEITIQELMEHIPGPDFPTGGIICGKSAIWKGYMTGRSTITLRARTSVEEKGNRKRIVIHEVPFQQARDRVEERIAQLAADGKIPGISATRNESDLKEPVRLVLELKRDADPDIVLNQLYKYSPLQDSVLDDLPGAGGRQAAGALAQGDAGGIRPPPRDGHPPPHAVPPGQGPPPQAHGAGPAAGARQHRRGDPRHPRLEDTGRGQAGAHADQKPPGRC